MIRDKILLYLAIFYQKPLNMLNLNIRVICALALFGLLLSTCILGCKEEILTQKDTIDTRTDARTDIYSGSEFFTLKKQISEDGYLMTSLFHPLLNEVYQEIHRLNDQHNFVPQLTEKIGNPLWDQSIVYEEPTTNKNVVLIPFKFLQQDQLSGMLSVTKVGSSFLFEGVTRTDILDVEAGDPIFKLPLARAFARAEQRTFQRVPDDLYSARCEYSEIQENGVSIKEPKATPCSWIIAERCEEGGTYTWVTGLHLIPLHLDHDQDGILNEHDQDWYEFSLHAGVTQSSFEILLFHWWEEHLEDQVGAYEDYYADIYEQYDNEYDNYEDFYNEQDGLFQDLIDMFSNIWDNLFGQDDPNVWGPQEGHDVECPWPNDPDRPMSSKRDIVCDWFYFLDCGQDEWWNDFDNAVPCPECPAYSDYQEFERDRLHSYYDYNQQGFQDVTFNELYVMSQDWDCDPYSPDYEECIQLN